MRRRDVIAMISGVIVGGPRIASAQRMERVLRIGCLVSGSQSSHGEFVSAFRQQLGEFGNVEGRDFVIDLRWAEGRLDRVTELTDQLARLKPDVVVTGITAGALAAKQAMPMVPIVSATLVDPIGLGLVASHGRPGGNVTGILFTFDTLLGKQLQLARELMPGARRIGMLVNMRNPSNVIQRRHAEATAPVLGVKIAPVDVHSSEGIDAAFQALIREQSEFVIVAGDPIFVTERGRVAAAAIAARLPTIAGFREFAEAEGLASYGIDLRESWRRAAYFVDRIFKGAKPANLPVEQPGKFELIVNLKTAKTLGITVPPLILARADEVIE